MSEKIQPQHLSRKAMLYVRQSSAFQVFHNLESGKLQYAMQTRLRELGFAEVEVIDENLGRSAAGTHRVDDPTDLHELLPLAVEPLTIECKCRNTVRQPFAREKAARER